MLFGLLDHYSLTSAKCKQDSVKGLPEALEF